MKRDPALVSLSREHHHALSVAQQLRRADESDAANARAQFADFWDAEGRKHFHIEEEVLLPRYATRGDAHHPLVLQALGEHVEIRAAAQQLSDDVAELHELGRRLADHVRLEERQLFPLIETTLSPDDLTQLAADLERAER
jgi:hemerythrin-like domain-containing protein